MTGFLSNVKNTQPNIHKMEIQYIEVISIWSEKLVDRRWQLMGRIKPQMKISMGWHVPFPQTSPPQRIQTERPGSSRES